MSVQSPPNVPPRSPSTLRVREPFRGIPKSEQRILAGLSALWWLAIAAGACALMTYGTRSASDVAAIPADRQVGSSLYSTPSLTP